MIIKNYNWICVYRCFLINKSSIARNKNRKRQLDSWKLNQANRSVCIESNWTLSSFFNIPIQALFLSEKNENSKSKSTSDTWNGISFSLLLFAFLLTKVSEGITKQVNKRNREREREERSSIFHIEKNNEKKFQGVENFKQL